MNWHPWLRSGAVRSCSPSGGWVVPPGRRPLPLNRGAQAHVDRNADVEHPTRTAVRGAGAVAVQPPLVSLMVMAVLTLLADRPATVSASRLWHAGSGTAEEYRL